MGNKNQLTNPFMKGLTMSKKLNAYLESEESKEGYRTFPEKKLMEAREIIRNLQKKRFHHVPFSRYDDLQWMRHLPNIRIYKDDEGWFFNEINFKNQQVRHNIPEFFFTGSTREIAQFIRQRGYEYEAFRRKNELRTLEHQINNHKKYLEDAQKLGSLIGKDNVDEKRKNRATIDYHSKALKRSQESLIEYRGQERRVARM